MRQSPPSKLTDIAWGASSHPEPQPATKRALIVKLGAIGDVIMAIPAADALRAAGFSIDWVASVEVAPLLALYTWIHVLPAAEAAVLRGSYPERSRGLLQLWRALRRREREQGRYDLAITLYYDRRYQLLSLPVRPHRRIALSRSDRRFELLAGRHHTDEYARILLDRPDQLTPWQLEPVRPQQLPVSPLPSPHASRPRIALAPAGARNALRDDALRRWPIENYVALASLLLQRGCEVVLVGGPGDRWASPFFAELEMSAGQPSQVDGVRLTNRIGLDSLLETMAVVDSATVTVTHDTGPLHMAGITETALVAIFGPTDPHGRLPRRANTVAIWGGEGFACRPCYDGRDYAPCPQNGCMQQVTPALVLAEVMSLVEARRLGRQRPPRVVEAASVGLVQLAAEAG